MRRTLCLRVCVAFGVLWLTPLPAAAQPDGTVAAQADTTMAQADDTFAPIAGAWSRHGFGLVVNDDGTSTADWRTYIWCGPGVADACDRIEQNTIISGGHADLTFTAADASGAFAGTVEDTSDPSQLEVGPVTLIPQVYDMLVLQQGENQITVCGEHAWEQAPRAVLDLCGA